MIVKDLNIEIVITYIIVDDFGWCVMDGYKILLVMGLFCEFVLWWGCDQVSFYKFHFL